MWFRATARRSRVWRGIRRRGIWRAADAHRRAGSARGYGVRTRTASLIEDSLWISCKTSRPNAATCWRCWEEYGFEAETRAHAQPAVAVSSAAQRYGDGELASLAGTAAGRKGSTAARQNRAREMPIKRASANAKSDNAFGQVQRRLRVLRTDSYAAARPVIRIAES